MTEVKEVQGSLPLPVGTSGAAESTDAASPVKNPRHYPGKWFKNEATNEGYLKVKPDIDRTKARNLQAVEEENMARIRKSMEEK